eukprot:1395819-Pyramimonas_sp.AAC.1
MAQQGVPGPSKAASVGLTSERLNESDRVLAGSSRAQQSPAGLKASLAHQDLARLRKARWDLAAAGWHSV